MAHVLVTGGAGFIGSHLVDALIDAGHRVRVLDKLVSQVHGEGGAQNLHPDAELVIGDVQDRAVVDRVLDDIEVVYHEAAEVGVGQSMYEMTKYVAANTLATTTLLEAVVERRDRIRKLLVASSMSIYGEGAYRCPIDGPVHPKVRTSEQLEARDWEVHCPTCGRACAPAGTGEDKPLEPTSVYAITKQDQEQLCLVVGRAYDLPIVALRYFNVYGPRQALSNPYTGVCAIFSSRLLNDQPPTIFEDGGQSRDFVHVSDIVRANLLALETDGADYQAVNIGTGQPTTVLQIAELLGRGLGKSVDPDLQGRFREGDIRHCVADIAKARELLGYQPAVALEDGLPELIGWVSEQSAADRVAQATSELEARGLIR